MFHFLTKDKRRSYQVVVAVSPIFIYLSYSLFNRVVLKRDTPIPARHEKIDGSNAGKAEKTGEGQCRVI